MAGSTKRERPSRARADDLVEHVATRLKAIVAPGQRVTLGFSGGVDSLVLLDVLAGLAPRFSFRLSALHVNHKLSPHAAAWARFCRGACRTRGIPFRAAYVEVARGNSTERAARDARYAVFARARTDFVVFAHNADDQAETVLLQLLRGAGVRGLAAMPELGPLACGNPRQILRPLLDVTRERIERYARAHTLAWIEDESNADTTYTRNWLRREVLPLICARVPAYAVTLARAARHCAEASALLDELARYDAGAASEEDGIEVARLKMLTPARAKNLLRYMIAARGWLTPEADRLHEALRQATSARPDARVAVDLGECELRRYRSRLKLVPKHRLSRSTLPLIWRGACRIALPELGGRLAMLPRRGDERRTTEGACGEHSAPAGRGAAAARREATPPQREEPAPGSGGAALAARAPAFHLLRRGARVRARCGDRSSFPGTAR
jgi:tRNA(Ile)-lysidine synthase